VKYNLTVIQPMPAGWSSWQEDHPLAETVITDAITQMYAAIEPFCGETNRLDGAHVIAIEMVQSQRDKPHTAGWYVARTTARQLS
jgi:hypothetical protein